jgi:hypothetical protein
MKIRTTFSLLLLSFIITSTATTQPSSAVVPDHGASAFGQGGFSFFNGFTTEGWAYSFDAVANKHGRARGRATFDIVENLNQTQVVVRINCLNVIGSSGFATAIMTGTVLHSDDPEFPKGENVIFAAEDNSNSPIVRPDIITRLFVSPFDCHEGGEPLTFFNQGSDAIHIEP